MGRYTYKIHKTGNEPIKKQTFYIYSDLIKMTTYQLREICYKERLVKNVLTTLDQEELIRLIMRYRGRKKALFIKDYEEEGLLRLEAFLRKTKKTELSDKEIRIPAKMILYDEVDLDYFDHYYVKAKEILSEGNLLLVDEEYQVYTVFNLNVTPEGDYYLTKSGKVPIREAKGKQFSILYLGENGSDLLYNLYYNISETYPPQTNLYKIPIIDFRVKKLEISDDALVIDFGSSNTTVGIYDNEKDYKLVKVLDKSQNNWDETTMIPSILAVEEIKEEVIYKLGYEAAQISRYNYLDEELPVFYDIKRWINDPDRQEKVMSSDGAYTWLSRKDLLRVYLEYVIALGTQRFKMRFKKIQILSPVRQKEKFKRVFNELLEDYEIECNLDEGVAVLFHSISNLIKTNRYEKNRWYHALVIDCGGGTTDLTSSDFKIDNNRVSYQIDMQCSYENGDTNFGGNNLTYRIMQLLKVRLVEKMTGENNSEKLQCLKANNFRFIDKNGANKVYEGLDEIYQKAEQIIPTRFREFEQTGAMEYFKVKSNYYYLFELAEQIKKVLFSDEEIYELTVSWKRTEEQVEDVKKGFRKEYLYLDKWKISVKQGDAFLNTPPTEDINLGLYEIRSLLMTDVYSIVKKFVEDDFREGKLARYDLIKLTGQSCQSGLFVEALKEFIPGRIIQDTRSQKNLHELKECCLSGALFYFKNIKMGYMDISHRYETGALPYEIIAYNHMGDETTLIASLQKRADTGSISRFIEGEQIELFLRGTDGKKLKNYIYYYLATDMKPTTFEEIEENYPGKIIQDETDNIVNGESKFFVWVSKEEWGFYILPVLRRNDNLYRGEAVFYNFEDDTWEQNYFDGLK